VEGRGRVSACKRIPINESINFIILEVGGDAPRKGVEVGVELKSGARDRM
jgi:hypothetical protein